MIEQQSALIGAAMWKYAMKSFGKENTTIPTQ
jgi:hypothetical protein